MCGIVGVYDKNIRNKYDVEKEIKMMMSCLAHRGPDESGTFVSERVALGHQRLSIIDLTTGRQPIFNEKKTMCITYNGEVYNYRELKKELIVLGHSFSTNSDTETILHAYEEWGEECVERLRGMFAFGIWDSKKQILFLARDRLGIKPLFYSFRNGKLVFASEIKSILVDSNFTRNINNEALAAYFMFSYIPSPKTVYDNINKLPAGHYLICKDGRLTEKKYWDLTFKPDRKKKEQDFIHEFMDLFRESVGLRLISDVPLGAFLSGGIDSSAIVAMMSGQSSYPVNSYTIGFGGNVGSFDDERKYARLVGERYGTNHREYEVEPNLEGLLEKIVGSFDEPFADDATLPMYFVSKIARENVKVILSGLGGDEDFCGYERYLGFHISRLYNRIPGVIRENIVKSIVELLPESRNGGNKVSLLKRFVRSSSDDNAKRYIGFMSKLNPGNMDSLFSQSSGINKETFNAASNELLRHFNADNAEDPLNKVFYCDIKTYLPEDILACTDRISMHHSLEVRVPFIDHELVEYCATIPPEMKIRRYQKKYLLKKAMTSYLPGSVIKHKKQGFVGPLSQWLKTDLKKVTMEKLSEKRLGEHGIVNPLAVRNILNEHYLGKENHEMLIWSLLVFQTWFEMYISPHR